MGISIARSARWPRIVWSLTAAALAGSPLVLAGASQAVPIAAHGSVSFRWSAPTNIDNHPPFAAPTPFTVVTCPTATFCLAGDQHGNVFASSNPLGGFSAWKRTASFNGAIEKLTCPTTAFCLLGEFIQNTPDRIFATSDPAGGRAAWHADFYSSANFSCPGAGLCVATWGGHIVTSVDPTAGSSSKWKTITYTQLGFLTAVSCASTSFCAVTDNSGDVVTSTNPAGGKSAWHSRVVMTPADYLTQISCPSKSSCTAVDQHGDLLYSTNPAGGASAWHTTTAPAGIARLTCLRGSFCYAPDNTSEDVLTSSNPAGGSSTWQVTDVHGTTPLADVSCGNPQMCVAVSGGQGADAGIVLASKNPGGGASAWKSATVDGINAITSLDCPTSSECLAGDDAGNVLISTNPAGHASAWHAIHLLSVPFQASTSITAIGCAGTSLCVAVDNKGDVLSSANPTGGASAWHVASVDSAIDMLSVSCPTKTLCVVGGSGGNILTSTNPTGGASAWHASTIGTASDDVFVSCPNASFCIGTGQTSIFSSTSPSGGPSAWHTTAQISSAAGIGPIDCPTTTLCVSVGEYVFNVDYGPTSVVYSSTHPSGGLNDWHLAPVGMEYFGGGTAVSCPSTSLCVASITGSLTDSTKPASHNSADWASAGAKASLVSCPTRWRCFAADGNDIRAGYRLTP
jgi:hypothetical protein